MLKDMLGCREKNCLIPKNSKLNLQLLIALRAFTNYDTELSEYVAKTYIEYIGGMIKLMTERGLR